MVEILAEHVYLTATNSDLSVEKRRQRVLNLIDAYVTEVAVAEYHKGRADGAIEACKGLGGAEHDLRELLERGGD
jgi:hypothetical protein